MLTKDEFFKWVKGLDEPDWMVSFRTNAFEKSLSMQLPDRKEEEWRKTDIRDIKFSLVQPDGEYKGPCFPSPLTENIRNSAIVSIDPHGSSRCFMHEDLKKSHVIITDMKTAIRKCAHIVKDILLSMPLDTKFSALHASFLTDGVFVYVPRGCEISMPISAIFEGGNPFSAQHNIIVVEDGASASYFEERVSQGEGLNLGHTQIFLRDNAKLNYITQDRWSNRTQNLATENLILGRDSRLKWFSCYVGSGLTKTNLISDFTSSNSDAKLYGLYLLSNREHLDIITKFNHNSPKTSGEIVFNGVCKDYSRAIFRGRIFVPKIASQTDSHMTNRVLLLSKEAKSESIPILEIEANDVRCKHAASQGTIDEDLKFYLMSRGINEHNAKRLVVTGFLEDILKQIEEESVRDNIRKAIEVKL